MDMPIDTKQDLSLTIPDMITIANALIGFLAITYVVDGRFLFASVLILVCLGLDGLDGYLARHMDVEHELGAYLDFFSDMVSFCFAPSILLYSTFYDVSLGRAWHSSQNALATFVPFMIVFLGTMRLARFADKNFTNMRYTGLPTPSLAILIINLSYLLGWGSTGWHHPYATLFVILGLGFLLYSSVRYPKIRGSCANIGAAVFLIFNLLGFFLIYLGRDQGKILLLFMFTALLGYVFLGPVIANDHRERKKEK